MNEIRSKSISKILCVDDDDDDAALFEAAVDSINKEILFTKCSDGQEAIDLLKSSAYTPDVILMDVNMPLLNGFDCLKEIREHPKLRNIPVFMLSTSASPKDVSRALQLGALKFYTKPNSFKEIQMLIQDILSDCRRVDQP